MLVSTVFLVLLLLVGLVGVAGAIALHVPADAPALSLPSGNVIESQRLGLRFESVTVRKASAVLGGGGGLILVLALLDCLSRSKGSARRSSASDERARLEAQLAAGARSFVRRTTVIERDAGVARASQIFEWFAADFEASGGVRAFLASNLPEADASFVRDEGTELAHFEYDWASNARP